MTNSQTELLHVFGWGVACLLSLLLCQYGIDLGQGQDGRVIHVAGINTADSPSSVRFTTQLPQDYDMVMIAREVRNWEYPGWGPPTRIVRTIDLVPVNPGSHEPIPTEDQIYSGLRELYSGDLTDTDIRTLATTGSWTGFTAYWRGYVGWAFSLLALFAGVGAVALVGRHTRRLYECLREDHLKWQGCCVVCGYDLHGVTERCPECGEEIEPVTFQSDA
ncbi:MAG: hypothetical protein KDA16_12290 [Phycisphaerales bacterium]|nr:hypothetical protein [Phycisphaerales bacterium]